MYSTPKKTIWNFKMKQLTIIIHIIVAHTMFLCQDKVKFLNDNFVHQKNDPIQLLDLTSKTAWITGASGGFSRCLASAGVV
jgi:hypothetical protein